MIPCEPESILLTGIPKISAFSESLWPGSIEGWSNGGVIFSKTETFVVAFSVPSSDASLSNGIYLGPTTIGKIKS